jgi:hypothetical protein
MSLPAMPSLFIVVQPRESDENAVELLKRLIEKTDVKTGPNAKGPDPNTFILSFHDVPDDKLNRIISDSKQWADDAGFLFLVYKDVVHSSVSIQNGTIENENVTVVSLLELE